MNRVISVFLSRSVNCLPRTSIAHKDWLSFIKTTHNFHLVDPSPWPIMASLAAWVMLIGGVLYMHKFEGGWNLFITGLISVLLVMYTWWRDVIREATFEDKHTAIVQRGLRLGMVLFIVSEAMFFVSFFWAFFHSSISPAFSIGGVWPPKAITTMDTFSIPLTNTFILLTSGASVTWAHQGIVSRTKRGTLIGLLITIFLAFLFSMFQYLEYVNAPFNISDGIYGSCFYMTTGFHGFHVIVGTIALTVALFRTVLNHFTATHHFGLESAIWYWHFVDIVWLIVFASIYWWGNK